MANFQFGFPSQIACLALAALLVLGGCSQENPQTLLKSGKDYAAKKDAAAAAIQFKAALQLDPKFTEARVLLGRALLDSGDPLGAALELTKALDERAPAETVVPALSRALLLAGEYKKLTSVYGELSLNDKQADAELKSNVASAWGALGDRAKTESAISAALTASPLYGPALILKARLLAGQRKFDEALALLADVTARGADLHEAWLLRGEILDYTKNDAKGAAEAYRKAIAIEKAFLPAHLGLVGQFVRSGDIAGAKAQAELMRAALPKHPATILVDAQLAFLDKQPLVAREKSQLLLRVFPNHVQVLVLNGAVEAQLGNLLQAESHFQKAIQLSVNQRAGIVAVARRNLAEVQVRLGQPAAALESLKPLLEVAAPPTAVLSLAGDAELRRGNAAAAEAYFLRAAKLEPENTRLLTAATLSQFSHGDPTRLFAELESLAAKSKDTFTEEAIFSARMKRREYAQALTALDAMDKKAPQKADLKELRGRVHLARRDFAAARESFEGALKQDPALFAATSGLANVDVAERKFDQALQRLQAAFKAEPRNHYALLAIAEVKALMNAPVDEMRKVLADAVQIAPTDAEPRLRLIDFLLRKRLFKDALVAAQEAATAMPNDLRVLDTVGRAQLEAGDFEQAITTYRRIAANDPNSALAYLRLGDIFKNSGRRQQAETAIRKALELDPGLAAAQVGLLDMLVATGRKDEALTFARNVQQQRPKEAVGYLLEASFHTKLKAIEPGIAVLRKGLARTELPEIARALYLHLVQTGKTADAEQFAGTWMKSHPNDAHFEFLMAGRSIALNQFSQAENQLRRVLQIYPDNALALNNMAWALSQQGKPGALAFAQRAADLAPENAAILDTLASVLAGEKQFAKALEVQRRAVEVAPENKLMHLNLAKLALQAGDKPLARAELEKLQALGAAYGGQAEVAKLLKTL